MKNAGWKLVVQLTRASGFILHISITLILLSLLWPEAPATLITAVGLCMAGAGPGYVLGLMLVGFLLRANVWELCNGLERVIRFTPPAAAILVYLVDPAQWLLCLLFGSIVIASTTADIVLGTKNRKTPNHIPDDWNH